MATIRGAARAISAKFDSSNPSVFLPDWVPTPTNRRYRRAVADLNTLIERLIADRRADPEGYDDLLARLLAAEHEGEALDDETLIDNTLGLLLAGTDTTATALTFAFWLLATHADAQRRLQDELDTVLDGSRPTATDLFALERPKAAISEAMRLYPPTPTFFREAMTDVEAGEYTIPAGTNVVLSQWVVHRDDRWYDDPEQFRPARWTDDFAEELHEYAYFPFGGGPRHCLGMRFAMTELQLALAVALQEVSLDPVTTAVDVSGGMTLSTAEPVRVQVQRR